MRNMSPERSGSPQEQASTPKMSVPASPVAGTPPRDAESPISLLLAVAQCQHSRANDDDLTSLSWLHERDVLKGINLVNPSPSSSVHTTPVKASTLSPSANSPTSDYVDESLESTPDSSNGSLHSPTPYHHNNNNNNNNNNNTNGGAGKVRHPHNVPYDPMIHTTSKPPYSFSSLIFMAIEDSEQKALPVKEIYAWIVDHFPYFKNAPNGWKNSVRHNLSLNKSFQKVEKAPNLGKGSLWTVHSPSRPSLVQQLTRSPFHPCSTLDPAIYNKPTSFDKGIYYRLPNPELFPYLSRSLAENEIKQETKMEATSDDSLDAVDAATVMLSLRNGPRHQHRKSKTSFQVITNSPSEDHTYSAIENVVVSPDISFESDEEKYSTSKSFICRKIDFEDEEERKIQEGAETLLNLAGITTKKRFSTHSIDFTNSKRKKLNHFVVPANATEKPTLFRPRLLRAKRKDKISNNNNNNNKFSSIQDDWARHRREMEEKKKR